MEEPSSSSGEAPKPASRGKALWIVIAVLVVIVVVVLAAAVGGLFSPSGKAPLRIGTLLSLTGGLALFGPGDTKGANLAVEEINAAGGVLGQKVEIYNEDDQTDSTAALAAATKLITQNHVDAIVGAQFSGGSLSSIKFAGDNGVVMVSPSATSVKLSDLTVTNGWFFRTISSDRLQGSVAASYLGTNQSFKYAAAMVINNPYGIGLGAIFKQKFEALGGGHVLNTTVVIPEKQADYSAALTQLFAANPQVVYFVAYPDTGLTVMKQWEQQHDMSDRFAAHRHNWRRAVLDRIPPAFAVDQQNAGSRARPYAGRRTVHRQWRTLPGFLVDQLHDPAVGVDVTKLWGTAPAAPVSSLYNDFVSRYKARYTNQTPQLYASHTYDAVYLIALAAQKAGAVDGASIKAQLRTVSGGLSTGGTVINGGQWSKALTTLAAGTAVNWEGASGSENLIATNDPAVGSYEIWGVNSTFKIDRLAFFGESLIQPVSTSNIGAPAPYVPNAFMVQLRALAVPRRG